MKSPTRVLIVDDSAVVRQLLSHLLSTHPDIEVIDTAVDAQDARAKIKALNPDVLTLDIEMPGMNGLAFLNKIMTLRPMPVVMVSTLTERGADASLQAMQLGAFDVFAKPKENLAANLAVYKDALHNKVLSAACANINVLAARARQCSAGSEAALTQVPTSKSIPDLPIRYRHGREPVIAIGSSTGGTEAVRQILQELPSNTPGIVIAQHIPETFSASFAQRLDSCSLMKVKEAQNGDRVIPGHAFVAPGHSHLKLVRQAGDLVCMLEDSPPVNRHRPSVDVLFDSVAKQASGRCMGIILTGMGKDGAEGLLNLRKTGAPTIAQDEASSVVWGMPRAAVELDAATNVCALSDMSAHLIENVPKQFG